MHNHPFDAKHQFKVNKFTDIERYEKMDETYVEPEAEEYTPRVIRSSPLQYPIVNLARFSQEHLRAWLADAQGRDQYVTYRGEDVEIWWHGKPSQSELAMKPVRFSTSVPAPSLTLHRTGKTFYTSRGRLLGRTLPLSIDRVSDCGEARRGNPNSASRTPWSNSSTSPHASSIWSLGRMNPLSFRKARHRGLSISHRTTKGTTLQSGTSSLATSSEHSQRPPKIRLRPKSSCSGLLSSGVQTINMSRASLLGR